MNIYLILQIHIIVNYIHIHIIATYKIDFCFWAEQIQQTPSQEVQQLPRLSFSEIAAKLVRLLAPDY